jgi:hypothetical protein
MWFTFGWALLYKMAHLSISIHIYKITNAIWKPQIKYKDTSLSWSLEKGDYNKAVSRLLDKIYAQLTTHFPVS